jgi:hypothetical protein
MSVRMSALTIVLGAALLYPVAIIAGGRPRFPSPAECVHPARSEGQLEAVFGRFERRVDAEALLRRVVGVGFKGTRLEPDGCGLLKVSLRGIPNLQVGRQLISEAGRAGFHAELMQAGS